MVAIPVETSLRVVMIATAKTKVARAVKSEATAMADAIKNNGLFFFIRLCFHVWFYLWSFLSENYTVTGFGVMFLFRFHFVINVLLPDLDLSIHHWVV